MKVSSFSLAVVAAAIAVFAVSTQARSADFVAEPPPSIDDNYWYLSIHGGLKFGEDWDNDGQAGDLEFEFDNGWRVGATVGYSLSSILSIEGELSYINQDVEPNAADDCCDDGDLSVVTGMVNLVAGKLIGTIRPYVGAGVGAAHVSFNDVSLPAAVELDDSDVVLSAQGLAGLDFVVSPHFALGARYRLLHLGEVELKDDGSGEHDLDPDLMHSIEAVFTVGF